jgi:hypothetical protein
MSGNIQQQRAAVEQLRREANIKRISVSQAVEDIKKYILDNEGRDYLMVGFSREGENPWREKSWSCAVL